MALQQREAQTLPSIIVPGAAARFRSRHDDHPYGRSPAMSIPGSDLRQEAPPPLPPPPMPFGNPNETMSIDRRDYAQFTPSLSSGYGSATSSLAEDRDRLKRRVTGIKTEDHDEGYSSWQSMERSRDAFPPLGFGLHHDRFQFQSPAGDVDSMKKKLDQMRPVDRSPPISSLSSLSSLSSRPPSERYPSVLSMPHQLPFHTRSLEPSRMSDASSFSPRSAPFGHPIPGRRSPQESLDIDRSPRTRSSRNNSDDASVHGGYEYYGAEEMEIEETSSLKRLQLGDVCLAGQKRRAPSDDLLRRGEANPRGSPTPRLATISQGVPVPSLSRSSSYVSNISVGPSSAATYDRRSPRGQSPSGISPTSTASPYTTPKSLNPSPRGSISGRATGHHRNVSSPRKIPEMQKAGLKMQGFFMCECCPKKPKKFETAEDLKAHEAEKQYNCQYCGNRFKNKNEAERHQNSLHVRRHSWSCSALKDYKRAFHESTSRPYEADTCGYCGEDFARSGRGPGGNGPRYATERDWEERSRHLQDFHKFGECNTSKKFFRADHFRQHLKHSHAGASGKWTNMLETACMIDEEPAQHR
ncbi:unnamed protein product [Clonostachys rosea]|uniref:C2H2-type domain-containing protein n=1 Tax=Bionectria ochroleuca TaxID=29856 RepID=A0ABY6UA39_BIOOC|nr:unnamed protein product [Clonostachys rosea]